METVCRGLFFTFALRKTERSLPLPIASQPKSLCLKWSPHWTNSIIGHRQIIHRISYSFSNNCDSRSLAILVSFGQFSYVFLRSCHAVPCPRLFYDVVTSGPSLVMTVRNEPRLARPVQTEENESCLRIIRLFPECLKLPQRSPVWKLA